MRRLLAKDVMSSPVLTIGPDATIGDAVRRMRAAHVSGLVVVDPDGSVVGIATEGDIVRMEAGPGGQSELAYAGRSPAALERMSPRRIADLMARDVLTATEHTPVRELARSMNRHAVNRIPIVRDGKPVGIVSRADVLAMFDRPAADVATDARRVVEEDLLLDPSRFEIVVADGVVSVRGEADPREIQLIETFVREIDGVASVDTSCVVAPAAWGA